MNKRFAVMVAVVASVVLCASSSFAAPKNGFGFNAGLASHDMQADMKYGGGTLTYSSSGLSLGIDYQIALSDTLSLNPFFMTSGESASGDTASGTSASHGILGLQLRYWMNDVFIGGHVASYSEVLSDAIASTSASGSGFGLVAGWEQPKGGLFVMGQLDKATIAYSDADVDMTGFRLSVGYRWK